MARATGADAHFGVVPQGHSVYGYALPVRPPVRAPPLMNIVYIIITRLLKTMLVELYRRILSTTVAVIL